MNTQPEAMAAHSFRVGEHDLVFRLKLTLETKDGTAVVDIDNAVKIEKALGHQMIHSLMTRLERHLELLAITPFQVDVASFVSQRLHRPSTPSFNPNATCSEQTRQAEVNIREESRQQGYTKEPHDECEAPAEGPALLGPLKSGEYWFKPKQTFAE